MNYLCLISYVAVTVLLKTAEITAMYRLPEGINPDENSLSTPIFTSDHFYSGYHKLNNPYFYPDNRELDKLNSPYFYPDNRALDTTFPVVYKPKHFRKHHRRINQKKNKKFNERQSIPIAMLLSTFQPTPKPTKIHVNVYNFIILSNSQNEPVPITTTSEPSLTEIFSTESSTTEDDSITTEETTAFATEEESFVTTEEAPSSSTETDEFSCIHCIIQIGSEESYTESSSTIEDDSVSTAETTEDVTTTAGSDEPTTEDETTTAGSDESTTEDETTTAGSDESTTEDETRTAVSSEPDDATEGNTNEADYQECWTRLYRRTRSIEIDASQFINELSRCKDQYWSAVSTSTEPSTTEEQTVIMIHDPIIPETGTEQDESQTMERIDTDIQLDYDIED